MNCWPNPFKITSSEDKHSFFWLVAEEAQNFKSVNRSKVSYVTSSSGQFVLQISSPKKKKKNHILEKSQYHLQREVKSLSKSKKFTRPEACLFNMPRNSLAKHKCPQLLTLETSKLPNDQIDLCSGPAGPDKCCYSHCL